MAMPKAARFIGDLLGREIDKDVRSRGERAPFVQIAKEWAARYREMRKGDPELPVLLADDFRDYLRYEYLVGHPLFYKLAPKG